MVNHVQLRIEAVARLGNAVLIPLIAQAQHLGIVAHELMRFFGETDVLGNVKEVVPVHPAIIPILHVAAMGHGQCAELSPMLASNQVRILRPSDRR
ncbi:hypothetical protein D3C77_723450 [compost metagenome]